MHKLVVSFTHLYSGAGIKGRVFTEKRVRQWHHQVLVTSKDANIMRKIYPSSRFNDKNALKKKYKKVCQISAVQTGVYGYMDATTTHPNITP